MSKLILNYIVYYKPIGIRHEVRICNNEIHAGRCAPSQLKSQFKFLFFE
jgi:hypothetical protein